MVHPTDSDLLALVHDEPSTGRRATQTHLASCASCQLRHRTLSQADGQVASLLTLLDAPPPIIPLAVLTRRGRLGRRRRSAVAAAAAILIAATAAAAVIPGTPLHRFFSGAVAKPALQSRPAPRPAPAPADTAGVAVAADSAVTIALRDRQSAGVIHVVWQSSAPQASVRAIGGDVGYTVRTGWILIENRRPALRYEITLPPTIPGVTLMMGDAVIWRSTAQADAGRPRQPLIFDLSKLEPGRE